VTSKDPGNLKESRRDQRILATSTAVPLSWDRLAKTSQPSSKPV